MSVTTVALTKVETHLDPFFLFLCKHVVFHHLGLDGHASEALEAQPALAGSRLLSLQEETSQTVRFMAGETGTYHDGFHKQCRFNTHAEMILLVCHDHPSAIDSSDTLPCLLTVSGLIGDDVPWDQGNLTGESVRPLMHVKVSPHTMPAAVLQDAYRQAQS